MDLDDESVQSPRLAREVMPPREALCDSCLGFETLRRRGTIVRAIWMSAGIITLAHLLEKWPW